jgi:regulation of enolase protein 1 (concanavalin A-like superfamily)
MMKTQILLVWLLSAFADAQNGEVLVRDDFRKSVGQDWSILREHREGWRVSEGGLELRVEPGNMWGASNNAKNVLVRPPPDLGTGALEVSVRVQNQPTAQYEQVDLVWYYDDGHMVKLGQELVNGKLSVVMGREEKDRTRTIAILPLETSSVQLQLTVRARQIRGEFRPAGADAWQEAGTCDLPAPAEGKGKISLQAYQGPAQEEHWARITEFQIRRVNP